MITNITEFKKVLESNEKRGMTLDQIKSAVEAGEKVYWSNPSYEVIKDKKGQWMVCHTNGYCVGLTHADGVTMDYKGEDFFIGLNPDEDFEHANEKASAKDMSTAIKHIANHVLAISNLNEKDEKYKFVERTVSSIKKALEMAYKAGANSQNVTAIGEGFESRIAIGDLEDKVKAEILKHINSTFQISSPTSRLVENELTTVYFDIDTLEVEADGSIETIAKVLNTSPKDLATLISELLSKMPAGDIGRYN